MQYLSMLAQAVSPEAPCGPDLEADPEAQAFLTVAEGSLPLSFRDFDRKEFNDRAMIERIEEFLKRSHDLRLVVLAAKTYALAENIDGFLACIEASRKLLSERWNDVHPQPAEGDIALRTAYIQSLDDRPTVILPLQGAPLFKDRRIGPVSHRSFLVAKKPALARSGETAHDESALRDALMRFEPLEDLVALRDRFSAASAHLQDLRNLFISNASYESAPAFDLLPAYLREVETILGEAIQQRSPSPLPEAAPDAAAEEGGAEGLPQAAVPAGDIARAADAASALQAVASYFAAVEPSSPARLLVRQARDLVGKSFIEAMQALAPGMANKARVDLGENSMFSLKYDKLQELAAAESPDESAEEARSFSAQTRGEASELMKAVERYFRISEPSSPVPLLLDRARRLMSRDFSSLLTEIVKSSD